MANHSNSNLTDLFGNPRNTSQEFVIEYWTDDDINELKEELDVAGKSKTTDFRATINNWNTSDDFE